VKSACTNQWHVGSHHQARTIIFGSIEMFSNHQRLHAILGYRSRVAFARFGLLT